MASTLQNGWQCSYRRLEPEKKSFSVWRVRWSRMRQRWENSRVKLQVAQERRPIDQQLELQKTWANNRRVVPR